MQLTILLVFVLTGCSITTAHLCARIYRRGSNTESWNLTLEGTSSANILLPFNQVGLLAPEFQCRLDIGMRVNGSQHWQTGSAHWKLRRDEIRDTSYNYNHVNSPELRNFCCSCHPTSCQLVQLGNACAKLFSETNCHTCFDTGMTVYPGDSDPNMVYGTKKDTRPGLSRSGIVSTVVNWGCKLTLFKKPNFEGNWRVYYNGVDESFGNFAGGVWQNEVGSYKCECPAPASQDQNVGEWITLVTNPNDLNSREKNESSSKLEELV